MFSKKSSINTLADRVSASLLGPLTEDLRQIATDSGWPESLISVLNVEVDLSYNLKVVYPESFKNDIEDLEYGVEFGVPNAVIRPFILRVGSTIQESIKSSVLEQMLAEVING